MQKIDNEIRERNRGTKKAMKFRDRKTNCDFPFCDAIVSNLKNPKPYSEILVLASSRPHLLHFSATTRPSMSVARYLSGLTLQLLLAARHPVA